MKTGSRGGRPKGIAFERKLCKLLSLWVSHGKDPDLLWRSAASGGRATLEARKGRNIRAAGDIAAVGPDGHKLTDRFFIECKFHADLNFDTFLLHEGKLWAMWDKTVDQALEHKRTPMLIAKQNRFPELLITLSTALRQPLPLAEVGTAAVYRLEDVLLTRCKL